MPFNSILLGVFNIKNKNALCCVICLINDVYFEFSLAAGEMVHVYVETWRGVV